MEVKCPKCRLRFDVPTTHGAREVQCFCPRCGTPFTFLCKDDKVSCNDDKKEDVSNENAKVVIEKVNTHDIPSATTSETNVAQTSTPALAEPRNLQEEGKPDNLQEEINNDKKETYPQGKSYFDSREAFIRQESRRRRRRHTGFMLIGLTIIIIFMVSIFAKGMDMLVGYFTDNDKEMTESLAVDSDLIATGDSTARYKIRGNNGRNKKHEAVPQWLQGRWHVSNANGYILMYIRGSHITVSDAFHTNKGTIRCKRNVMICKYDDGRTFRYNIDRKHHRIIVQKGMVMKKAEE